MLRDLKKFGIDVIGLILGTTGSALVIWPAYALLSWEYDSLPRAGFFEIAAGLFVFSMILYTFFKVKELSEY